MKGNTETLFSDSCAFAARVHHARTRALALSSVLVCTCLLTGNTQGESSELEDLVTEPAFHPSMGADSSTYGTDSSARVSTLSGRGDISKNIQLETSGTDGQVFRRKEMSFTHEEMCTQKVSITRLSHADSILHGFVVGGALHGGLTEVVISVSGSRTSGHLDTSGPTGTRYPAPGTRAAGFPHG